MANPKKKGPAAQQLSPSNYIRQKSRTLPIHECLVNSDWKDEGLANILISRQHTNGKLTVCTYLVDLKLLGVKDTIYLFSIEPDKYEELKDQYYHQLTQTEQLTYAMAHNIIFSAIAFAEEFEFKPHRDFASTTQYFLEEDDDNIELIDIECGVDGKPCYINGPYDTPAKIDQIVQQLERTAGAGNYEFHYISEDDWDDEDDDEDDEWAEAEEVK